MAKISLIVVIWVWHCVVNGQLLVNNFDPHHPYFIPYMSTLVNQPIKEQKGGVITNLSGIGELGKNSLFQGAIFLKIKQLETTVTNLVMQLKETTDKLQKTQLDVLDLTDTLKTKADQTELKKTNDAAATDQSDLKKTNDVVATKADQSELKKTNDVVTTITSPNSIGKIPGSCRDLNTVGFVKSGIYSIMINKRVQNVYCDFTKSSDADFQKFIGYVNVKSSAVYFFAQRNGNYATANTGIPFNKIGINEGKALDASTGEFQAPSSGKYFFVYTGLCWNAEAKIYLQTKSSPPASWINIGDSHCTAYNTLAITSTLQLAKGDLVRIFLFQGTTHDEGNNFTNYVGWLLEEDIV